MTHSKVEVRGYTLFGRHASGGQRALAFLNDLCWVGCADLALSDLCRFSPVFNVKSALAFATVATGYFLAFRYFGIATPGERICKLKRKSGVQLTRWWSAPPQLYSQNLPDRITVFMSAGLTLVSLLLTYYSVNKWVFKHPLWAKSSLWEMKPFVAEWGSVDCHPVFLRDRGVAQALRRHSRSLQFAVRKWPASAFYWSRGGEFRSSGY